MSRFWSAMHGVRSAIAVAVAVLVMLSSVLTVASHAASPHNASALAGHFQDEKSSLQKAHDCTAVHSIDAADRDQPVEKDHSEHSKAQSDGGCDCICNPSAQLGAGNGAPREEFTAGLNRPLKDAMLASIAVDTDDPPIIRALS